MKYNEAIPFMLIPTKEMLVVCRKKEVFIDKWKF